MPPQEYFQNPYYLPESSTDSQHKTRKDFIVWYLDHFLLACAGKDSYKSEIKHYRMPVQLMTVKGESKKSAHVTKESEALGHVIVENCYVKWGHIVPEKAKNHKWKIPDYKKDKKETHKYHDTKWSDGRNGQIKGGGWSPGAFDALNEMIKKVKQWRSDDKQNGWKENKRALTLLKQHHGIPLEETKPSKRRRKGQDPAVPPPVYADVAELSDSDCEDDDGPVDLVAI